MHGQRRASCQIAKTTCRHPSTRHQSLESDCGVSIQLDQQEELRTLIVVEHAFKRGSMCVKCVVDVKCGGARSKTKDSTFARGARSQEQFSRMGQKRGKKARGKGPAKGIDCNSLLVFFCNCQFDCAHNFGSSWFRQATTTIKLMTTTRLVQFALMFPLRFVFLFLHSSPA